jgi:hypothetical protein
MGLAGTNHRLTPALFATAEWVGDTNHSLFRQWNIMQLSKEPGSEMERAWDLSVGLSRGFCMLS